MSLLREKICSACNRREFVDYADETWTEVYCAHQAKSPTLEFCALCVQDPPGSAKFTEMVDAALDKIRTDDATLIVQWSANADCALVKKRLDVCRVYRQCAEDLRHRVLTQWSDE